MFTVREFAKHFDFAMLAPNCQEAQIVEACASAAAHQVNSVNVNSCWIDVAARELKGTGVGHSAVIGFPYGTAISKVKYLEVDEIWMCGFCTDICVSANFQILKAMYPEIPIVIISDACAGVTPAKHEAALEVMRSCQAKVVTFDELMKGE